MNRLGITAAVLTGLGVVLAGAAAEPQTKGGAMKGIQKSDYGQTADGQKVDLYTLTNGHGVVAKITNYGGIVTELHVPDKNGQTADVVLGFDSLKGYLGSHPFFGALVGRYANRIAGGRFTLNGKDYTLARNNGPNSLHGGLKGFDKKVWKAEAVTGGTPALRLTYHSPDGEEGYPGNLDATVTYTLTDDNGLRIDYEAKCDQPTPVNLTNHSYFNLAGQGSGTVLNQTIMIAADAYTPVDGTLIPTGKILPVKDTPFDLTQPTPIGERINAIGGTPSGFDHNYVLRQPRGDDAHPALAARVRDPQSGRVMEVLTTQPGVQFYTGNFLDGTVKGKGGAVYNKHAGFCLETQHFPDSVHHPNFPSVILRPGETYRQTTVYKFAAQ